MTFQCPISLAAFFNDALSMTSTTWQEIIVFGNFFSISCLTWVSMASRRARIATFAAPAAALNTAKLLLSYFQMLNLGWTSYYASTMAWPMPWLPPVTITVWPACESSARVGSMAGYVSSCHLATGDGNGAIMFLIWDMYLSLWWFPITDRDVIDKRDNCIHKFM